MGVVFGIGVVTTIAGAGNWLARWNYDRHNDTHPNQMEISRWGFFYAPLKVALGMCGVGVLLMVVGGVGSLG
jgi:hypothetical protein